MNTLIRASAGSGKTYALTTEYLRLLRERSRQDARLRPESLLATTFTRKAAGEIFDRILYRLASAALEEAGLNDLRDALGDPSLTQAECQALLLRFCRTLGGVSIGTLDSIFQRLCGVYRQETGLTGGVRVADPKSPRCRALHRDAIHALLDRFPPSEIELLLDDLHAGKVPSPVVESFDDLLDDLHEKADGVPPDAWDRLEIPKRPDQAQIEAACAFLQEALPGLPDDRWRKAVQGDLPRFEKQHWDEFCSTGLAAKCLDSAPAYFKKPIPPEIVAHYGVLLTVARCEVLAKLRGRTLALRNLLAVFTEEYATLRRAEGLTLFYEAPRLLAVVLGDHTETARRLDAPIEHLLFDEFQDTSDVQWNVMRGFARSASEAPRSVFVVGDMKQAIYGWRGGRAEIFERAEAELPGMAVQPRDVSFRSSQVVLDVVNRVFGSLQDIPVLAEHGAARDRWRRFFQPHQAQKNLEGTVELCLSPLNSGEDTGGHLARSAERIAERVGRLPSSATVGVLVRRNATVSALTDLLRALGLDVSSEGSGAVADDPAVEVVLAALMLADHPGHATAAFHVVRSPLAGLLGVPPDLHARPADAARVSNALRRRVLAQGYAGVIAEWASVLAPFGTERTARRLEQLMDKAIEFDLLPPMRASEFVRAVREAAVEHPGAARVRVMTINRAKGLEFDAVFLPEMDWAAAAIAPRCLIQRAAPEAVAAGSPLVEAVYSYPNTTLRRLDAGLERAHRAYLDEEITGLLCLLYVALTRARHALHVFVGPPGRGLTPAAILRHALADDPAASQADDWATLFTAGNPDWHSSMAHGSAPPEAPAPPLAPLHFRASDGTRRQRPASLKEPVTAADLLATD